MSEKFCLKWNDYNSNISKSFSKLRNEESFYDVTLVSDDQKQISAHKVVLSACSEYFKNILKQNVNPNPLLCLDGISSSEMIAILDYIYCGEVNIYQEDVDRFLNIAERLKLAGLIFSENDAQNHDNIENDACTQISCNIYQDFQNIEELDAKILEYIEKDVTYSRWKCKLCDRSMKLKGHIKEHVEIHFEGLSFPCKLCDTNCRSRHNLRNHINSRHK